jgi:uncharacterized delta-60 repeat protein
MRKVALRRSAVVAMSIAMLCCAISVRAQSVDGTYDPGANQTVSAIAVQPDGKTIVGGGFTGLGGGTGTTLRNRIGRLNVDGTVDPTFNPGTNAPVLAVAVQADGKILAGGNFTAVGGGTGLTSLRSHIARFNADGSVDATFDPGASLNVFALAVQPDGKILVGGSFSNLGGGGTGVTARKGIARLNADGSLDTAFNPGASKLPSPGAPPEIHAIVVQPDGKIVLGGYFNGLGSGTGATTRNFIGRLNADGTVDGPFDPGASSISGVSALALQADGKILVGGSFTGLGGGTGATTRGNIGRINSDGTVDLAFNPGAEAQVLTLGVQTDGKILAGGLFKWLGGGGVAGPAQFVRNYIGRLNTDGSVDTTLNPSANKPVNVIALQTDGGIVMGGTFDRLNSTPNATTGIVRNSLARVTNTTAGIQTLTLTGAGTIETWMRSGGGPEVSRVTFEFSFDGSFYSMLGNGTRIAGGWTLTSVNLPTTRRLFVRARGYYETGQNGSGSIAQSILIHAPNATSDHDGDGKADLVVFRPSSGTWYVLNSSGSTVSSVAFGASTDVPVPGDYDGDGLSDIAVYRPSTGTWSILQSTAGPVGVQFGLQGDLPVPGDYDGDGKTDIAVYRPSTGTWYILQSSTGTMAVVTAGLPGDVPVPADYDGDGKTDPTVFRPSTGVWFIRQSTTSTLVSTQFGLSGDVPVPGDYDGDGKADIAIYRPSSGTWYVLQSTTNFTTFVSYQWGVPGDLAEPGDYDGDGKFDIVIFRPSNGTWYVRQSSTGYNTSTTTQFGLPGDRAVPGALIASNMTPPHVSTLAKLIPFNDFDGDSKADLTVLRPSTGTWFTLKSSTTYTASTSTQFGLPGDLPVTGDYDGDGKTDIAIFRPSTGTWYVLKSSDSTVFAQQWGLNSDIPVPGDYDGDGKTDFAVFRPASGTWFILKSLGSTFVSYAWGVNGDTPVPGDYDGDGASDLAVFRPSTGEWFTLKSSTNFTTSAVGQWGLNGDIAVPGDYDGDGKTDFAVWRPSNGTWFVLKSGTQTALITQFGVSSDIPVAGDYDGDGSVDVAVYRPSGGTWFLLRSTSGFGTFQFGLSGDIPILKRP